MLRISKLTDYGTVVLSQMVTKGNSHTSASELSDLTDINFPTVSKILKILYKAKIVDSVRGANGGYKLIRNADEITIASIIDAFEGPISITDCSSDKCKCKVESHCNIGLAWQNINQSIRSLLEKITLSDIHENKKNSFASGYFAGMPINVEPKAEQTL